MKLLLTLLACINLTISSSHLDARRKIVNAQGERADYFHGPYLGIVCGLATTTTTWSDLNSWTNNFSNWWTVNNSTVCNYFIIEGTYLGFNWQADGYFIGIEGNVNWMCRRKDKHHFPSFLNKDLGESFTIRQKIDWTASPRVNFGVICDKMLVFLSMGACAAKVDNKWTLNNSRQGQYKIESETFYEKKIRWGLSIGTGAEYALTNRLHARVSVFGLEFPPHKMSKYSVFSKQNIQFDIRNTVLLSHVGLSLSI